MEITIAKLMKEDFSILKEMKLQSLKDSPLAYDTSYEEAIKWTDTEWSVFFSVAMDQDATIIYITKDRKIPVGYIRLDLNHKMKKRHIAEFDVLFVSSDYRKQGLANKLFDTLLLDLKENHPEVIKIHLSVYAEQVAAIAFYKKLGFEVFGEFEKELCVNDQYYKKFMMDLFL